MRHAVRNVSAAAWVWSFTLTRYHGVESFVSSSRLSRAVFVGPTATPFSSEMRRRRGMSIAESEVETNEDESSVPGGSAIPEDWKADVLGVLSNVIDPDLNDNIVRLGFVKELTRRGRAVSFDVELTTPACPVKEVFREQCVELVTALPWTTEVEVTMTASAPSSPSDTGPYGMAGVSAVVAVSSCKGGVGKSTTAVNLAYALKERGAAVGLLDCDVYGPSLPTMVEPDDDAVRFVGRQIAPLERDGVRLMSFGYVNEGSAIMRGPMVTQLLDQVLSLTNWGQLDYLVLDLPPGTGDVQLTLCQRLNITAAVIVTTPQELSYVDVERGVYMFDEVNVPCVAVVENMAYVDLGSSESPMDITPTTSTTPTLPEIIEQVVGPALSEDFSERLREAVPDADPSLLGSLANDLVALTRRKLLEENNAYHSVAKADSSHDQHATAATTTTTMKPEDDPRLRIFGPGHRQRLSRQWGIEHTFSVPLVPEIARTGDSGRPFFTTYPDSHQAGVYRDLASSVVQEVSKILYSDTSNKPILSYDHIIRDEGQEDRHLIRVRYGPNDNNDDEKALKTSVLRRACRCASCVEELTGRALLRPEDIPETVRPVSMEPCGNYAVSVDWNDGHRSLYPYKQIAGLLEENAFVSVNEDVDVDVDVDVEGHKDPSNESQGTA